jgi:MFS family permease
MAASVAPSLAAYARLVRDNRNFRRLWSAQIVSELGDWFYVLAIYSLLLQFTGRAESLSLALVFQVLPQTFIGPLSGVVNDRTSRKRVMIAADILRALIVLTMLLVRSKAMVWLVWPLLLCETLGAAFFEPARSSVIPNIVAKQELTIANTLASTTWSFNLMIGTALGGIAGVLLGRDAVFVLNALSFVASALLIRGMRFDEPHLATAAPLTWRDAVNYTDVAEGIRYMRTNRRVRITVFAKMGIGIVGTAWVLFPIMGRTTFRVESFLGVTDKTAMLGMSVLMAARGLGALIGPLFSAPWAGTDQRRLRLGILIGFMSMGIGYFLISRAPGLGAACAAIIFAHLGGSSVWVFSTTLLQLNTEDAYRGRVFSAELGLCMLSIAICAAIAGVALDSGVAPRIVAAGTGAAMLIPTITWGLFARDSGVRQRHRDTQAERFGG